MGDRQSKQKAEAETAQGPPPKDCDLEIFLIGKTGHGKSATGNSILGDGKFKTSLFSESATLLTDVAWAEKDELTVKVVDGPGLLDTRLETAQQQINQMEVNISEGFLHSPNGFHALVLVLSYCGRFTEEERRTVTILKGMLGDSFIQNHCIIVFTHGENFLMDCPDGDFKKWCGEQKGDLQQLLNECNNRAVLFYNKKPETWDKSRSELISMAQGLHGRYTSKLFETFAKEREKYIEETGAIQLRGPIQSRIDMIITCLKKNQKDSYLDRLVDGLEQEINKYTDKKTYKWTTVHNIKKGIHQTKENEYKQALETFEKIELEGKTFLSKFLSTTKIIVKDFLMPIAKTLLKQITRT